MENLVHSLFLVYLSISTSFGRLCVHHQEKQVCLCDTWYLLFYTDDCLVCSFIRPCIPYSHPYRITSTKCRVNTVVSSWWWAHSRPKHVEIDKYTKNKLCTKLALFTRLYRNVRSTKHKILDSCLLTLILLTWRIWWAPNNASRWQVGFNLTFKGLRFYRIFCSASSTDKILSIVLKHLFKITVWEVFRRQESSPALRYTYLWLKTRNKTFLQMFVSAVRKK